MTETNRDFIADKEREYRLYLIWRSLPRELDEQTLETYGITDETILELSQYKTQKALAEHLGVRPTTITDWNKHPIPDQYKELDWRYWAKKATPTVANALLKQLKRHGDAARFQAWMRYVEQEEDKTTVTIDASTELFDQIKTIADTLKDDS